MSDYERVMAMIEETLAVCAASDCEKPIAEDSPSADFCSYACQQLWHAERVGSESAAANARAERNLAQSDGWDYWSMDVAVTADGLNRLINAVCARRSFAPQPGLCHMVLPDGQIEQGRAYLVPTEYLAELPESRE